MAQDLGEQINTIERSLGERMIDHALVIVRAWLNELGESNPYEEAFRSVQTRYKNLFEIWLSVEDDPVNEELNNLTGETYQLVDAVYADIRLQRGLSPQMHGFNRSNPQSVINYFANCVKLTQEDYDWLRAAIHDPDKPALALLATGALAKNLRECFSIEAMMLLIEGMDAANELVADQCIAYVCMLLIHYDIRMDYFPQLQAAFTEAYGAMADEGEQVFDIICALVRSSHDKWVERFARGEYGKMDLPDELVQLLEMTGKEGENSIETWLPQSESEYMESLMEIFPDTWLCKILLENDEERERQLALTYLSTGCMDLIWNQPEAAEKYLLCLLRKGGGEAYDYINYGHLQMLKGDKMLAYEYYRQGRSMCRSSKEFLTLFRPGRRGLADYGVPLEQIYLIEDKLLQIDN